MHARIFMHRRRRVRRSESRLASLKRGVMLIKDGRVRAIGTAMGRRVYSDSLSIGLSRDLTRPIEVPPAKIPFTIRPFSEADRAAFDTSLRAAADCGDTHDFKYLSDRLRMLEAGFGTCYLAVASDDRPCFVQWLLSPQENEGIAKFFGGSFPVLRADEALLEHAYTFKDFRGLGIMAPAMAQIAEQASEFGASRVITFVDQFNLPSLKGCGRAGFAPFLLRRSSRRFFRLSYTFEPSTDTPSRAAEPTAGR